MLKLEAIASQESIKPGSKACFHHGLLIILAEFLASVGAAAAVPRLHLQAVTSPPPLPDGLHANNRQKQKANAPKATGVQRVETCSRALHEQAAHSLGKKGRNHV